MRSARPGVAATNSTVSPAWRARLISSTQSAMRPRNSTAGWQRKAELRPGGCGSAACAPLRGPGRLRRCRPLACRAVAFVDRQLLQPRAQLEQRGHVVEADEELLGRRDVGAAGDACRGSWPSAARATSPRAPSPRLARRRRRSGAGRSRAARRSGRRRSTGVRLAARGGRAGPCPAPGSRRPASTAPGRRPHASPSRGRRRRQARRVDVGSVVVRRPAPSCAGTAEACATPAPLSPPSAPLPAPPPLRSKHLAQRHDRDAVDLAGGALRGRVEVADRLDGVADEVEADGLRGRRRGRCRSRRRGRRTRRERPPGPAA